MVAGVPSSNSRYAEKFPGAGRSGIQAPTMKGGIKLDPEGKNTWNHSILSDGDAGSKADLTAAYDGTGKFMPVLKMADPRLAQVPLDLDDGYKTTILSIFPTLIVALKICWDTRHLTADLIHNIAVALWICANTVWMIGEFFYGDMTRAYAKIFFYAGMALLAVYYTHSWLKPRQDAVPGGGY